MKDRVGVFLVVALLVVGCTSSDDTELSTTSSVVSGGTGAPGTTAPGGENGDNGSQPPGSPNTTLRGLAVTEYRQVHSEDTSNGAVLHLVIPRGGYTEIDIESFVRDIRESQTRLWGLELFDNADAQIAFMVPPADRTDDQRTLVTRHHLVTLTESETLIWRGPFSSLGQSMIGS